jgi:hypothetical protein
MLTEIIDTLGELKRMHQLNLELMEQLDVTCGWLLDNNIQVPNHEHFLSLLIKARTLLKEIYARTSSDGILQRKKSDKDFTVPVFRYCSLFVCSERLFLFVC